MAGQSDPWRDIAGQAEEQWNAFIGDPYAKAPVHQSRVKLRQLRSMLAAVKKKVSPAAYAAWQHEWRAMGQLLGDLRQGDVLEEAWEAINKQGGQLWAADTELPWRRLRQAETAAVQAQAVSKQQELPWQRFFDWLALYRQDVSVKQERKIVLKRLDKWIRAVEAVTRRDGTYADELLVHERRILGKKLRYALLAFFPGEAPELLLALKRWQACLGALHDSQVHRQLIADWAEQRLLSPEQKGLLTGWELARAAAARKQAAPLEALVVLGYWQWRKAKK